MAANNPDKIIVHHSGGTDLDPLADTSAHTAAIVNEWHKAKWPKFVSSLGYHVGYHYFIEKGGKVVQCRRDDEEGAHCIGQNKTSIGVCLAGNFDATLPTPEQEASLAELLWKLTRAHGISADQIGPHRQYAKKSCYGKRLADEWARELMLSRYQPIPAPSGLSESDRARAGQLIGELEKLIGLR